MRLKSPFFVFIVLAFIALFFLNTWQGLLYEQLKRDAGKLELEQRDWLEKNKKVIAALAVLSSPGRVESLALNKLGLKRLSASDLIKLEVEGIRDE